MTEDARKIAIIGGGIAGLCAAVYARKCGYQAEILEMHDSAGGLAASWRRDGYTFENALHALPGSNPDNRTARALWREVCDIDKLTFVVPDEFIRVEDERGERLSIYTNVDRIEAELLSNAPQDEAEIRRLASAARRLKGFEMPDPGEGWHGSWLTFLRTSLPAAAAKMGKPQQRGLQQEVHASAAAKRIQRGWPGTPLSRVKPRYRARGARPS